MAGAAFGQFIMLPGALKGIEWLDWSGALVALSVLTVAMVPLAFPLFERGHAAAHAAHEMTAGQAIRAALRHRGFVLLALSFFVCGFQMVFLAHQLGTFLGGWLGGVLYDRLGSYDGAWSLAIGLSLVAALLNLPIKEQAVALPEPVKA